MPGSSETGYSYSTEIPTWVWATTAMGSSGIGNAYKQDVKIEKRAPFEGCRKMNHTVFQIGSNRTQCLECDVVLTDDGHYE